MKLVLLFKIIYFACVYGHIKGAKTVRKTIQQNHSLLAVLFQVFKQTINKRAMSHI